MKRPPRLEYSATRIDALRTAFGSLVEAKAFTTWRYLERDGKWGKVPTHPTGTRGVTFEEALKRFQADSTLAGLGVKLGRVPDTTAVLFGVDYDGKGKGPLPENWPASSTYSERSPSGGDRFHLLALYEGEPLEGKRVDAVEIYSEGRFFTLTGDRINGAKVLSTDPRPYYASIGITEPQPYSLANQSTRGRPARISDSDLTDRERQFLEAVRGIDDPDLSKRDFAVCAELAKRGATDEEISRVLCAAFWREKLRRNRGYIDRTISAARKDAETDRAPAPGNVEAAQKLFGRESKNLASRRVEASATPREFRPVLVGIDEVLASKPPDFVVPELLPVGLTLLAAPPKSGKSMLALQLAASIAAGGNFLGFDLAEPSKAIYLALDNDAEWRIKQRLLQMFGDDSRKLSKSLLDRFFVFCGAWESGNYQSLREVCECKPGIRFVVIDVLLNVQRGKRKDEGVYAYDYQAIGPITAIANELGIAILGITHTNKRQDVSHDLERVTGSLGVTAAGSSVWMLERSKESPANRTLVMTGRDVTERTLLLTFDQINATFGFAGDAADLLSPAEERIAEIITAKGPIRFKDLRDASGLSQARVAELLNKLLAQGFVAKEGGAWKCVRTLRKI